MFCVICLISLVSAQTGSGGSHARWAEVTHTLLPVRERPDPESPTVEFISRGEKYPVLKTGTSWIQLQVNDSLKGWVPMKFVIPTREPAEIQPGFIRQLGFFISGILIISLIVGIMILRYQRRARGSGNHQLRLSNKIILVSQHDPTVFSKLLQKDVGLRKILEEAGYEVLLLHKPDEFYQASRGFRPNVIIAEAAMQAVVEEDAGKDVVLLNTPVIYLNSAYPTANPDNLIRVHLGRNPSDRDIFREIQSCLKRTPKRIQYSVNRLALKGNVLPGNLPELLHFFASVQKTGRLNIRHEGELHWIDLKEGRAVRSSSGHLKGKDALEALLAMEQGQFEFEEKTVEPGERPIVLESFLLEWARKKDEERHSIGH